MKSQCVYMRAVVESVYEFLEEGTGKVYKRVQVSRNESGGKLVEVVRWLVYSGKERVEELVGQDKEKAEADFVEWTGRCSPTKR